MSDLIAYGVLMLLLVGWVFRLFPIRAGEKHFSIVYSIVLHFLEVFQLFITFGFIYSFLPCALGAPGACKDGELFVFIGLPLYIAFGGIISFANISILKNWRKGRPWRKIDTAFFIYNLMPVGAVALFFVSILVSVVHEALK